MSETVVPNNWEVAANAAAAAAPAPDPAAAERAAAAAAAAAAERAAATAAASARAAEINAGLSALTARLQSRPRTIPTRKQNYKLKNEEDRGTETLTTLYEPRFPFAGIHVKNTRACTEDHGALATQLNTYLSTKSDANRQALLNQLSNCIAARIASHENALTKPGSVGSNVAHRKIIYRFIKMYNFFSDRYNDVERVEYIDKADIFRLHVRLSSGGRRNTRKAKKSRRNTRRRR